MKLASGSLALTAFGLALSLAACSYRGPDTDPEVPFARMTPAQHLQKAKQILTVDDPLGLSQDQIQEAARNLDAIPSSAPEFADGTALKEQSVQLAYDQLRAKLRTKYANEMQASLRHEGFDISVTELGDKLIIADDLPQG